ncbi:MAG: DbpA RNA binding domain-containing protein [Desulfamplus sp.]|nr:DbpA RNA binding domain-containing protein [Desulfamplus sp.]
MPPVARGMERFRLDVGNIHGVKAGDIVGAIANEAGLDGKFIGNIVIHDEKSTVDLPEGMPEAIFKLLKKVRVVGQKLNITKIK